MSTLLTIFISVFVFGFLIFIHELGHYLTARLFKVTINEFSVGMGPRLLWYDSKKTGIRYSLAIIPIGGFVAMAGEDGIDESAEDANDYGSPDTPREGQINRPSVKDDPNAFCRKPAWQRFIITAAGATVNIVAGFLAMLVLVGITKIGGTEVAAFIPEQSFIDAGYDITLDDRSEAQGLKIGDVITHINGKRVLIADELSYEIMRFGHEPIDITLIRGGEEVVLEDVVLPRAEQQGQTFGIMDFQVYAIQKDFGSFFSISLRKTVLVIRMCWESIIDLVTGRYTLAAVSGPVGISGAIGEAAKAGIASLLNITVLISINLGFMNLLPIPALDGGRLLTILVEMITRKKLPPRIEAAINGVGLMLLLLLSVIIMIKDVVGLF